MVQRAHEADDRPELRQAARLVGIVFLIVGIAGFIPGITEDAPGSFAGENSEGSLLGVFQTSVLHNLVHLLFGVAGLVLSRTADQARTFLVGGGIVYLLLFGLGIAGVMDWLPADDTDDWLHLGLGVGMLALGLLLGRRRRDVERHEPVSREERDERVGARVG
jgi:MYXO-CTERM domain-containing protein